MNSHSNLQKNSVDIFVFKQCNLHVLTSGTDIIQGAPHRDSLLTIVQQYLDKTTHETGGINNLAKTRHERWCCDALIKIQLAPTYTSSRA